MPGVRSLTGVTTGDSCHLLALEQDLSMAALVVENEFDLDGAAVLLVAAELLIFLETETLALHLKRTETLLIFSAPQHTLGIVNRLASRQPALQGLCTPCMEVLRRFSSSIHSISGFSPSM